LFPEEMGEVGEADDVLSKSGGDAERVIFNDEGLLMLGVCSMAPAPGVTVSPMLLIIIYVLVFGFCLGALVVGNRVFFDDHYLLLTTRRPPAIAKTTKLGLKTGSCLSSSRELVEGPKDVLRRKAVER
jgi:hypothetical protein